MGGGVSRGEQWHTVDSVDGHPLSLLIRASAGVFRTVLFEGPRSRFGAKFFLLRLQKRNGDLSREPVLVGLYNRGRFPSQNWIEIAGTSMTCSFDKRGRFSIDPHASQAGRELWQLLGKCVPTGGHIMVEYESLEWRESCEALIAGLPPVVTPLGNLLFEIGCGTAFKDWYFSEGLHEGPRKLQGCKALDGQHWARRAKETVEELRLFLASEHTGEGELLQRARECAKDVLIKLSLRLGQMEDGLTRTADA